MIALDDIFDQPSAVDTLARAYRADRLPHGLIFAGPVGVGKATTARALGNLFLCERPLDDAPLPRPCGNCDACRMSEAQAHPDYHRIVKELIRYHDKTGKSKGIALSLEVMRGELLQPAARTSILGRGKVFAVEQSELMTVQAQNAILKTLEEPAGRTLIVLLTDQPGVLLPTVRSRCQTIRFAPLPATTIRRELQKRHIDPQAAAAAAELADGSLGLALKWIHEGVIDAGQQLRAAIEHLIDGRTATIDLPAWFRAAAEAYAAKQLERDSLSSKDQATREGLALYLTLAGGVFRRRLATGEDPQALEAACAAIDALVRAEQYLDANVNIPLIFHQLQLALKSVVRA